MAGQRGLMDQTNANKAFLMHKTRNLPAMCHLFSMLLS